MAGGAAGMRPTEEANGGETGRLRTWLPGKDMGPGRDVASPKMGAANAGRGGGGGGEKDFSTKSVLFTI